MNAEALLAQYERIAEAPDAIARLRRFVLDLAVRGKLVPQDSSEGSAARLMSGTLPPAAGPHDLPPSWAWVRIGDQLDLLNGMAFKPTDWVSKGIPIVRIQNLNNPTAPFNFCRPEFAKARSLIDDGAFLISWSGTPGTSFGAFIWERGPAVLNQHIFRCDFKTDAFFARYLQVAINGRLDEMIAKAHGGVGLQHITKGKLEALLIALPPLAEQHRIVAKVDELMALCDQLEAARTAREATRDRLAAASLARLNTPDPETFPSDARFALDALPALTTRPDQIKHLRQTILNLAVRGKLSESQREDEGTADDLLMALRAEQANIGLRVERPAAAAIHHEIPNHWRWSTLGQLITFGPQNGLSPKPTNSVSAPKAITLTATTSGVFDPTCFKHVDVSEKQAASYWLADGDLLFQRGNTREYVGIAAIYRGPAGEFLFPDLIIRVRVSAQLSLPFIHLAAVAPPARALLSASASGAQATMPKINQTTLLALPIPIPPLAEQHRIVVKVNELMALCDALEASLAAATTARTRLLEATLAEALAPSTAHELEAAE
jgi:type I restriction enzyme S subunit